MFKSTILPAAAIVIAGLLLGLGFNGVRPKDRLKLTRNYFMKIQVADSASQSRQHGFTTVTLDFLPKGGLVSTMSKCEPGSVRKESSVLMGG